MIYLKIKKHLSVVQIFANQSVLIETCSTISTDTPSSVRFSSSEIASPSTRSMLARRQRGQFASFLNGFMVKRR